MQKPAAKKVSEEEEESEEEESEVYVCFNFLNILSSDHLLNLIFNCYLGRRKGGKAKS